MWEFMESFFMYLGIATVIACIGFFLCLLISYVKDVRAEEERKKTSKENEFRELIQDVRRLQKGVKLLWEINAQSRVTVNDEKEEVK